MTSSRSPDFSEETERLGRTSEDQGLSLVVLGKERTTTHNLPAAGTLTIGRSPENQVQVDEPSISRRHALLVVGQDVSIRDLGSANGVRVRNRSLDSGEVATIKPGEAVELGAVLIVLHSPAYEPFQSDDQDPPGGDERVSQVPVQARVVRDPVMKNIYSMVDRVGPSELSVLILGETGVGKEVIAEAIHDSSRRVGGPFVRLNCSALTESLVESELFGHEKGAFTGAGQTKMGLLEAANGGTVFLDEVGELPMTMQAKLLRVLEDRKVMRVGSLKARSIDVRFISATNRDPQDEIARGAFRQDLYFRLNGITIEIPPLRQRRVEISPLARRFAADLCKKSGEGDGTLSDSVIEVLERYPWPGNVRELRNALERATVLAGKGPVATSHLPLEVVAGQPPSPSVPPVAGMGSTPPASGPAVAEDGRGLKGELEGLEKQRILDALEQCSGNQTRAAEMLGMSRRTFVKRLDQYHIPRPRKKV